MCFVGGNAMGQEVWEVGIIPEKELYIRWFQLVTFLQSMQISISPWQYDSETVEITRTLVSLHTNYVAPRIISLAKETVKTGLPIIRPLWWNDPDDITAHTIGDQFLIGKQMSCHASQVELTGLPIIRPLWWNDPDSVGYACIL